jgi:hypothetical protein
VGRFNLVIDTLMTRMFDVYYSGELGNDYRDGLIHFFGVRDDISGNGKKPIYRLEYTIPSKSFIRDKDLELFKIEDIYRSRKSSPGFTLSDSPTVNEIVQRLVQKN